MAMLVAALLALQYNLFWFIAELSEPQRKISLAEAIFLTILLALLSSLLSFVGCTKSGVMLPAKSPQKLS